MPGSAEPLKVLVTSVDGRAQRAFRSDETINEVHKWAYPHVVQDKGAVPFGSTWIEHQGNRVDGTRVLSSFGASPQKGSDPDLTLGLAWQSQGGAVRR